VLMVIFGAGASFDSDPRQPPGARKIHRGDVAISSSDHLKDFRLPLAKHLFGDRFNAQLLRSSSQPSVGLHSCLREAARKKDSPVEQEIEKFVDMQATHPETTRQLLSLRYYIRDVITDTEREWLNKCGGLTNYVVLLQDLREWSNDSGLPICLVTFNYDTLIDKACRDVLNMSFPSIDHYVSSSERMLIKLHGSVDWFREACRVGMRLMDIHQGAILQGSSPAPDRYELQWGDKYALAEPSAPARAESTYFAAIAVPTATKSEFECPASHQQALIDAIPRVSRLLVIGWRGMETHFHKLWQQHRQQMPDGTLNPLDRLHIVDRDLQAARDVEATLRAGAGIIAKEVDYTESFSKFVDLSAGTPGLSKFLYVS
jgi:hypothetical protein